MIFINNKYTTWYYNIISNAKLQNRKRTKKSDLNFIYYEQHHIVPKSLNGTNSITNLILLTAREHFICHWLLTKMTSDLNRAKMLYALRLMKSSSDTQHRYITCITSRVFAKLKAEYSAIHSSVRKGKTHTAETKAKMSTSQQSRSRLPMSDEAKQHLSDYWKSHWQTNTKPGYTKGRIVPEEELIARSLLRKGKPWTEARRLAQAKRSGQ